MRRHRGERGASLVEFALLLPIFMMMVLGMFSGGVAYNKKLDMSHATRDGARYGAAIPKAQVWTNGDTWANNVRAVVVERSAGDLTTGSGSTAGVTTTGVCVALVSGAANNPTAVGNTFTTAGGTSACFVDDATDSTDRGVRIQVSALAPSKIEALLFTSSLTLKTKAIAKYESQ